MPPIALNRRRFLGCSAAAGLALSQGRVGEGAFDATPVRIGVIGLGTRGTSLLRTLLELPAAQELAGRSQVGASARPTASTGDQSQTQPE